MVREEWRAQRIAKSLLDQSLASLTVKARTDLRGRQLYPGDRINITSSRYGWTDKLFRVTRISQSPAEGGTNLILKEDSSTLYVDPGRAFYTQTASVSSPTFETVTTSPPRNLVATTEEGQILLTWDLPIVANWRIFVLLRSETENKTDAEGIWFGSSTSHIDTDVIAGYRVLVLGR